MKAEQLIESYVYEVVRKLPQRQRSDVAAELGALLREELAKPGRRPRWRTLRGGCVDAAQWLRSARRRRRRLSADVYHH
jgi:hypothetical protein